jgi:hypothetical protein
MEKVYIMELKSGSEHYSAIGQMNLARVPVAGDKIFIEHKKREGTITYVYNVIDVHFADERIPDVCVVNIGERIDYLQSLGNTHILK